MSGSGNRASTRACIARSPESPSTNHSLNHQRKCQTVNANHLAIAAGAGDPFALRFLSETWPALQGRLAMLWRVYCPARITEIGGGVSLMGEELLFLPASSVRGTTCLLPSPGCRDCPGCVGRGSRRSRCIGDREQTRITSHNPFAKSVQQIGQHVDSRSQVSLPASRPDGRFFSHAQAPNEKPVGFDPVSSSPHYGRSHPRL